MSLRAPALPASLLVAALLAACGAGDDDPSSGLPAAERITERVVQAAEWDTVFAVGGEVEDTLVLRPLLLAARGGRVYLYDHFDHRVKAFDAGGALRWTFGRAGYGPDEFRNAFDVEVGPDGAVWVVDAGAGRITIVEPGGTLRGHIRLDGRMVRDVLPLAGDTLALPVGAGDHLWVGLDDRGRFRGGGGFPIEGMAEVDPLVRIPFAAVGGDSRTWAAAFPQGEHFVVYEGREPRCRGSLVEGGPFPEPSGGAPLYWIAAIAVTDSSVFVLANGRTGERLRLLDEYSAGDCRYRRTLLLPRKFVSMAHDAGTFYLGYEQPAPGLMALRPVGADGARAAAPVDSARRVPGVEPGGERFVSRTRGAGVGEIFQ